MSAVGTSPQRILELWPRLTAEDQVRLVQTAESMAVPQPTRRLSPREKAAVDRSRADFAAGRVLDDEEYEAAMSTFMAELEAAAASKS